jgi:hypothetical protein
MYAIRCSNRGDTILLLQNGSQWFRLFRCMRSDSKEQIRLLRKFDLISRPIKMGAEILSEFSLCATFGFGDYLPL